jgi:hypothetical protein
MRSNAAALPALTADQMREVDRLMIEEMHIDLLQMMETPVVTWPTWPNSCPPPTESLCWPAQAATAVAD